MLAGQTARGNALPVHGAAPARTLEWLTSNGFRKKMPVGRAAALPVTLIAAASALVAAALGPAMAADAAVVAHGHRSASLKSGTSGQTGRDISYPQCGKTFPAAPAFGIVGINGGLANDLNPCLGPSSSYPTYPRTELYWAASASTGVTSQPKASLYVNTADPGNIYNGKPIADWPTSGSTPYGACTVTTVTTSSGTFTAGQNSPACAWQYGYNRASQDASWLVAAASAINAQSPPARVPSSASGYPWWLDVETVNSWQSGTSGQAMNVADLQGMIAGLQAEGAVSIGAYSTATQWNQITGGTTTAAAGTLFGIPDWIPGARSLSGAQSNCALPSFTAGHVTLTQWVARGADYDHAC